MTDYLNEQTCELEEYNEQLIRRLIENVTVLDDRIEVEFKSGLSVDTRLSIADRMSRLCGVLSHCLRTTEPVNAEREPLAIKGRNSH
jgi:hypothetical protein